MRLDISVQVDKPAAGGTSPSPNAISFRTMPDGSVDIRLRPAEAAAGGIDDESKVVLTPEPTLAIYGFFKVWVQKVPLPL